MYFLHTKYSAVQYFRCVYIYVFVMRVFVITLCTLSCMYCVYGCLYVYLCAIQKRYIHTCSASLCCAYVYETYYYYTIALHLLFLYLCVLHVYNETVKSSIVNGTAYVQQKIHVVYNITYMYTCTFTCA